MKYYSENNLILYFDDTFERLKKFPADYVDMINERLINYEFAF